MPKVKSFRRTRQLCSAEPARQRTPDVVQFSNVHNKPLEAIITYGQKLLVAGPFVISNVDKAPEGKLSGTCHLELTNPDTRRFIRSMLNPLVTAYAVTTDSNCSVLTTALDNFELRAFLLHAASLGGNAKSTDTTISVHGNMIQVTHTPQQSSRGMDVGLAMSSLGQSLKMIQRDSLTNLHVVKNATYSVSSDGQMCLTVPVPLSSTPAETLARFEEVIKPEIENKLRCP